MTYLNQKIILFIALILGFVSTSLSAEPVVSEVMKVVEMHWQTRTPDEQVRRIQFAANMVAGQPLDSNLESVFAKEHDALQKWSAPFKSAPNIKVKLLPAYDELRVLNKSLVDKWTEKDIGEAAAIRIAYNQLQKLLAANMLSQRSFNLNDVQVGYNRIIEGSKDGKKRFEAITEYRLTFRPNIDGIQLANAGVRVAVHRSGAIAGLRIGGVTVDEKAGFQIKRSISRYYANTVVTKWLPSNAKPDLAWSRIMYVMPEDAKSATVEPTQVYSFSLKTESDGVEVISRRKIVGVSLSSGELIDYTAPTAKEESQAVVREEEV